MWWGHSPALDIQFELNKHQYNYLGGSLDVLIVGARDARHILKTIASSYLYNDRIITYNVIESSPEQVARSIILLNTCLDANLGLQEATRYYLEILGNTLVRPATAKYLIKCSNQLADISTITNCPWLCLDKFKYKDRDTLAQIFKFWEHATCENIPIVEYWDRRVRDSLKTRYDYREGVFDWDYHMILKSRGVSNLTLQEYRLWRNSGLAFTWLEGELVRSNPTLLSNIRKLGSDFIHSCYVGDIANGPFHIWILQQTKDNQKYRATDIAERAIMRLIHEIRTRESMADDFDTSPTLNGILVIETPNKEMEQEKWMAKKHIQKGSNMSWIDIRNHKVMFHSTSSLKTFKNKEQYIARFDFIWVAHNMMNQLRDLVPLLKKGGIMLVELQKFILDLREEDLKTFVNKLKDIMLESGLKEICDINAKEDCIATFRK